MSTSNIDELNAALNKYKSRMDDANQAERQFQQKRHENLLKYYEIKRDVIKKVFNDLAKRLENPGLSAFTVEGEPETKHDITFIVRYKPNSLSTNDTLAAFNVDYDGEGAIHVSGIAVEEASYRISSITEENFQKLVVKFIARLLE